MQNEDLNGSVVLISGASSGIGLAIAKILDQKGAQLVLQDLNEDRLRSIQSNFKNESHLVFGDISDSATSESAVSEAVAKFGRLDKVIANAGIYLTKDGWTVPANQIDQVVGVNVLGVMHLVHTAIKHFLTVGGGDIVVTSSVAGLVDVAHEAVYSATKNAVTSFVNSTRSKIAGNNIRIGSIEPGIVQTPLWETKAEITGVEVPQIVAENRALKAEDVAQAVLFMISQPRHVNVRDVVLLPTDQIFS